MPRKPRPLALSVALLAGCASSGTARPGDPPIVSPDAGAVTQGATLVTSGGSYSVRAANNAVVGIERAVPVPPDSAFYALVEAYQGVGITPNTVVSSTRTVGVVDGQYRQQLGRRRLSEFVSCGTDAVGIPLADQYRVTLSALSRVAPGGSGGSVVTTQVTGTARSVAQSTDPVRCESTGRLEAAINALAVVRSAR